MGHSTIKVTMDIYAHLMSEGGNESVQEIAGFIFDE